MTASAERHGRRGGASRRCGSASLDVVAGAAGLDRRHHQSASAEDRSGARRASTRTSQPGRVLVFGESEVHYLAALEPPARVEAMRARARARPSVHRWSPAAVGAAGARRAGRRARRAGPAHDAADAAGDRAADRRARRSARAARDCHGVLLDILGLGVLMPARAASARASARWTWWSAGIGWSPTTRWR